MPDPEPAAGEQHRSSVWDPLRKIGGWLRRDDDHHQHRGGAPDAEAGAASSSSPSPSSAGLLHRRTSRKAVPGLPRPLTFKRMNSEKRDRLLPVPVPRDGTRRATSRPAPTRPLSLPPPPLQVPSTSAPDVLSPSDHGQRARSRSRSRSRSRTIGGTFDSNIPAGARQVDYSMDAADAADADGESGNGAEQEDGTESSIAAPSMGQPPPFVDGFSGRASPPSVADMDDDVRLQEELEARWILNLSMHFRDRSDREKFFITFAEEPTRWRRVTVSCDYRELAPDSLEADLKSLHYQRDKSARIYEAIRDSLPDIQFYPTVTNLKLQTADGRLHVHVTEDVNEIIPYPQLSAVDHLDCKRVREGAVSFDSHISGFVYKVRVNGKPYIKKEIPGPDAVDEFLYEINALCTLQDSNSVIQFEGVIVDEKTDVIKGLLISYADQGALVDIIYDFRDSAYLSWERRERWARQIVEGLSEIHEAGFVQGDFTLSNIVVDRDENAKIIDINRRGCPVGWEPPELARLIESGQRISIYIGVKSDLFQLGMVLWALAEQQDEPERQERPLYRSYEPHSSTPQYYRDIVQSCLDDNPRRRPAAKDILARFPEPSVEDSRTMGPVRVSISTHRPNKEYIDPSTAVDLEDIPRHSHQRPRSSFSNIHMPSTEYLDSSGSYILPNRSRSRSSVHPSSSRNNSRDRRSDYSPYRGPNSILSLDDSELDNELASLPASRGTRWEQVYVDGDTKLVQRGGLDIDAHEFAPQEPKDVCITTPPGELCNSFVESTKSSDTPVRLAVAADMQPSPVETNSPSLNVEPHRQPSNKASFSDRIHHPNPADDPAVTDSLADLENEVALDASVTSSAAPSRVGTGFSDIFSFHPPMHQDSGFNEPDPSRTLFDNENIRPSIETNRLDLERVQEDTIGEQLWDEEKNTLIVEGANNDGHDIIYTTGHVTTKVMEEDRALEEKMSNATIRPSLMIPDAVREKGPDELSNGSATDASIHQRLEDQRMPDRRLSNSTIRPPSLIIPEFHHGVPQPADQHPTGAVDANRKEHQNLSHIYHHNT